MGRSVGGWECGSVGAVNYLLTINYQLSIINYPLSTINYFGDEMVTEFIETEISLKGSTQPTVTEIEAILCKYGQPLRWSITTIDRQKNTARIEAIVIN